MYLIIANAEQVDKKEGWKLFTDDHSYDIITIILERKDYDYSFDHRKVLYESPIREDQCDLP